MNSSAQPPSKLQRKGNQESAIGPGENEPETVNQIEISQTTTRILTINSKHKHFSFFKPQAAAREPSLVKIIMQRGSDLSIFFDIINLTDKFQYKYKS